MTLLRNGRAVANESQVDEVGREFGRDVQVRQIGPGECEPTVFEIAADPLPRGSVEPTRVPQFDRVAQRGIHRREEFREERGGSGRA